MAKTTLSITAFLNVAKALPPDISILTRADHGIGKSDLTRQLAVFFRERDYGGKGFPIIDRRISQLTEGDIIGLPSTDGEVTRFNPPDWVKQACREPVLLYLDEMNRGTTEVMQACFQLVLDRELQGWKLHPGTRVYASINTGAAYTVQEMDPALLDRFWTIDLKPTHEEWIEWAKDRDDMLDVLVDFLRINEKLLDPPPDPEPGAVNSSRRSWHRLSRSAKAAALGEDFEHQVFYQMCLGFVGLECTSAFFEFGKHYDAQVTGSDILNKFTTKLGKKNIPGKEGDDNKYNTKIVKRLEKMGQERLHGLIEKVADAIKKECTGKGMTPEQGAGISKFTSILPAELRIAMWAKTTDTDLNDQKLNRDVHRYIAPHIMNAFGVPMGKAGVGVSPNIPDIFKNDKK